MWFYQTSTFGTFLINYAEHAFYIQNLEIEAEDKSEIGKYGIICLMKLILLVMKTQIVFQKEEK